MQPLTERQQLILNFIVQSIQDRGYPPTLREIGTFMGIRSTNGVSDHLVALERKGYLVREDMKSRALRPVDLTLPPANANANTPLPDNVRKLHGHASTDSHATDASTAAPESSADVITVPVLGRVAAGPFSLTSDSAEHTLTIDRAMVGNAREVFALKIKGDSMIDAGIHDGDTIFVKRTPTASRGDIVVARLGDEATVKRFFPERDHFRLQPENTRLAPILVNKHEAAARGFEILGTVVGLFRKVVN